MGNFDSNEFGGLKSDSYQFFNLDTNYDNYLTGIEYMAHIMATDKKKGRPTRTLDQMWAKIDKFFAKYDKNGDGLISYPEFEAAAKNKEIRRARRSAV